MAKKKEKNRDRRLIIALLVLLISGIALTTATYAWFSANRVVTANDINIKVTTASGISIAADATSFGKKIEMQDVIDFAKTRVTPNSFPDFMYPVLLNPVTTIGNSGGGWNFFTGTLTGDGNTEVILEPAESGKKFLTGAGETNNTLGDFIMFDVYLRTSTEQDIKLGSATTFSAINPNGQYTNLDKALRIGMQNLGNVPGNDDQQGAIALNNFATDDWFIWNTNAMGHFGASYMGYYNDEDGNPVGGNAIGDLETVAKQGYYAGIDSTNGVGKEFYASANPSADYFKNVKDLDEANYRESTTTGQIIEGKVVHLLSGITKVRIYIWVEGQDVDCEDGITGSKGIQLTLAFESMAEENQEDENA